MAATSARFPSSGSRRVRGLAALSVLAVGLAMVGCSTTRPSVSAGGPLAGITPTTVKVGFTIVDLGSLNLFKKADYGGVEGETKAINAIVDHINAQGGMGGRKVVPVIRTYVGATDSPTQSQALCNAYTQDDKVFAVVADGLLQNNGVPCYSVARTIIVDETLAAHDQVQFERTSPYLWSPTHPEYGAFVRAQLETMNANRFFDGASGVLVVPSDNEVSRRVTQNVVQPYLSELGVGKVRVSSIDGTDIGTLGESSAEAMTTGRNAKLDRVVVVGGARIQPVAISSQVAASYPSRWAISTFDSPQFSELNPDVVNRPLLTGQVGLGYDAFQDVALKQQPPLPDPSNPAQVLCHRILTDAGATPPAGLRQNWSAAMQYCDGAMFLKAVLDQAPAGGAVSGAQFKSAAAKIGDTFHSASTLGSQWGPGVYAGTSTARALVWKDACTCYDYVGAPVRFGPDAAGSAAAPVPLETITVAP